jgi:hypothetical protein
MEPCVLIQVFEGVRLNNGTQEICIVGSLGSSRETILAFRELKYTSLAKSYLGVDSLISHHDIAALQFIRYVRFLHQALLPSEGYEKKTDTKRIQSAHNPHKPPTDFSFLIQTPTPQQV